MLFQVLLQWFLTPGATRHARAVHVPGTHQIQTPSPWRQESPHPWEADLPRVLLSGG